MERDRPTEIGRLERINAVRDMLIQGYDRTYILQSCAEKHNINDRCIDGYISEAKKIIKSDFERCFDVEDFKSEIYGRYQDLYKKNYEIEDFRECRNVIADMNKLLGLNAPKKIEIETNELSAEERARRIKEITDRISGKD